jgi:hypothetical protein
MPVVIVMLMPVEIVMLMPVVIIKLMYRIITTLTTCLYPNCWVILNHTNYNYNNALW